MGTAVLGEINNVIRGTARMEKPNPVRPCNVADTKKITIPATINSIFISKNPKN